MEKQQLRFWEERRLQQVVPVHSKVSAGKSHHSLHIPDFIFGSENHSSCLTYSRHRSTYHSKESEDKPPWEMFTITIHPNFPIRKVLDGCTTSFPGGLNDTFISIGTFLFHFESECLKLFLFFFFFVSCNFLKRQ